MRMRSRTRLVVLAALFSSAVACTGGGGDLDSGDDYSVEGALGELPASVGTDDLLVQTADVSAATELSGLERPTDLDPEAVSDWILPLTGVRLSDSPPAPVFVPVPAVVNPRELIRIEEFDDELGWSLLDVDSFVEQSTAPETFAVVTGDFEDDQLNPDLAQVSDDIVSAGDGDDLEPNVDQSSAARPVGTPLRMSQDGDRIVASASTPLVQEWVAGGDETLADDETLASVAAVLDDADVVAAVLASGSSMDLGAQVGGQLSPELSPRSWTGYPPIRSTPWASAGASTTRGMPPSRSRITSPMTTPPQAASTRSRGCTPTASASELPPRSASG